MMKVDEVTLRMNRERVGRCVDYMELSRDKNMPFFTWDA